MRYERQFCAECKRYTVHYGLGLLCIAHENKLEQVQSQMVATALDWTYRALERQDNERKGAA